MIELENFCTHCQRYVFPDYWHEPDCPQLVPARPTERQPEPREAHEKLGEDE